MISSEDMSGEGFTLIVQDIRDYLVKEKRSQNELNEVLEEIHQLLLKNDLDIGIVMTNTDAMRLQSKMMFNEYVKHLDKEFMLEK